MEQQELLVALNLEQATGVYLTGMQMVIWGRDLLFECLAGEQAFQLHFLDCRETRWQLYSHMQHDDPEPFPQTELANLKIGRDQHRSPAHLLTEHFGLSLIYGELQLQRDGEISHLGR